METRRRLLGEEHPSTLSSMANLASTWNKQGKIDEAITLLERCYKLQVHVRGPSHHHTVTSGSTLKKWQIVNK